MSRENKNSKMSEPPELTDDPGLPQEIIRSALSGELVLFVGAGVSMLLGLPSWSGLADKVLEELRGKGFLDYSEVEQLKTLDPRKRLSIADTIAKENDYSIEYKRHLSSKDCGRRKHLRDIKQHRLSVRNDKLR